MKVKVIGCLDARTICCAISLSGASLKFGLVASATREDAFGKRVAK